MSKPKFFDLPVELQARLLCEQSINAEMFKKWKPRMLVDGQEGAKDNEILMDGVIVPHEDIGYYREYMGDDSAISARLFRARLQEVEGDPVIRMNSPGGDVHEGVAIVQAIEEYEGAVTCMVDSQSASIASVIMAKCDKVIASVNAEIMIHTARAMVFGTATKMREFADYLDRQNMRIVNVYNDRMKDGDKDILAMMDEETFFTAEEALGNGLVDEIYKPKKNKDNGDDKGAEMKDSANNHLVQQIAVLSAA